MLLNCDLGEWEDRDLTRSLMKYIDMANIACGGHAGSVESIRECLALCKEFDVLIGAHPGLEGELGRSCDGLSVEEFQDIVCEQLDRFIAECGDQLHHVKLHGSLYHLTESDKNLRQAYLDIISYYECELEKRIAIVCLANGQVAADANDELLIYLNEAFLDRAYRADGTLQPRDQAGALLHGEDEIKERLAQLSIQQIRAIDGSLLTVKANTLCVHSDSPDSLKILEVARAMLK